MELEPVRIFPLGDNALTVEFGTIVSEPLNEASIALAEHFNVNPFPGMIEAVPAIASTTIFYRSQQISSDPSGSAFDRVSDLVRDAVKNIRASGEAEHKTVTVPVSFSGEDALDLVEIAEFAILSREEVIDLFLSTEYRVYMLGFLPGFAYMGVVDDRIAYRGGASRGLPYPKAASASLDAKPAFIRPRRPADGR
jgi:inhibitor of KinA